MRIFAFLILLLGLNFTGSAQPLGSSDAKAGGVLYLNLDGEPNSLHPITAEDAYARQVLGYTFSALASTRLDNYELEPELAEKWEVSKDNLTFTFTLRQGLKFQDGTPITPDDVKFSFDAIFDPQFKAFHLKPYFENIGSVTIEQPNKIVFKAKKVYFNNLNVVATMTIIPKHVYGKFDKKQNRQIVGSGPYKYVSSEKGKSIILEKNKDWFGWSIPFYKGMYSFDRIFFRFIEGESLVLEYLKRGQIDYEGLTPEQFVQKTDDAVFKEKLTKVRTINSAPGSYGFIGWNLRNPMFADRDVRVALAHLMNRELMIKKFLFDMSVPAAGPWHFKSPYASPAVKPFNFDPKEAARLFAKAGWSDTNKDGVLDKVINGKSTPFKFALIYSNRDVEKYFTIYKEDLKKAGVDLELKLLEWNSFLKLVDGQKFEACALGWGGGSVDIDPKQIWHSDSDRSGGHNFIGYKNPEVDRLIDKARDEMERSKRIPILKKAYEIIAADAPYLFLFNRKDILYAHNKRIKKPKDTFTYGIGVDYWWLGNPTP